MHATKENTDTSRAVKALNIIMFMILFAALIGVSFTVYLRSRGISINNTHNVPKTGNFNEMDLSGGKVLCEISYSAKDKPAFCVYKGLVIKYDSNGIKAFNKQGKEAWSMDINAAKPFISTNGSELLVADLDGKDIYVISGKAIKWSTRVNGNIISADIGETGHVAVVHEDESFRSVVRVYDSLGKEMFYRNIAQSFVIGAKISPSGELLVVNSFDASGVDIEPCLEFFDMMGNPFAGRIPGQGIIFPAIWYLFDDSLFAASESQVKFYDRNREEKWSKEFDVIYSTNTLLEKYIVVAVNEKDTGESDSSSVKIFNTMGREIASCQIAEEIRNVRTFSDLIAVNAIREVYFINSKGRIEGKYTSKSDIEDVFFFNRLEAAIVTKTSVTVIKVY